MRLRNTRIGRFVPLLLALLTLAGLGWLAAALLIRDEPPQDVPVRGTGLTERYDQFESYPRMARAFELIRAGQLDAAADWLQAAIEEDPRNLAAIVQLAELRLRQDRPAEALPLAERAIAIEPGNPKVQWLLARARAAVGDYGGALAAVEHALEGVPPEPGLEPSERHEAELAQVGYLLELGRTKEAEQAVAALRDPPVDDLLRLGDLYYRAGDTDLARRAFAAAQEKARAGAQEQDWAKATSRLAEAALKAGDTAAAEAAFRDLAARDPGNVAALESLSNLAEQAGRTAEAADWARQALAAAGRSDAASVQRLARLELQAGDAAAAARTLDASPAAALDRAGRLLKAQILLRAGRPAEAADWARQALEVGGPADAGLVARVARLQLQAGDAAAAARTLAAIPDDMLDAETRLLKARVLLAAGEPEAAARAFEAAAHAAEGASALADLRSAAEALRQADAVERELALRRRIAALSGSAADRDALVARLIALKRFDAAAQELQAMAQTGDPGAAERLANVLVQAGRRGEAVALLQRQGRVLAAANLAAGGGDLRQAAGLLADAFRRGGARDPELLARAIYAARQSGDETAALAALQSGFPFAAMPAEDRRRFTALLAQMLDSAGRSAEADRILAEAAEAHDDPGLALDLATRLAGRNECDAALQWADRAMAAADPPPRLFALAGICAASLGLQDRAVTDLQTAIRRAELAGERPDIAWLNALGYLHAERGEQAKAAALWQRSLARRPDPAIALAAAVALRAAGAAADADALLATIDPADLAPDRRAQYFEQMGIAAAEAGDVPAAIALVRQSLELDPNVDRWFRLGNLLSESGDKRAALAAYEKASGLGPANADIQAAMGYAYVALGEDAEAEAHFARALQIRPEGLDAVWEDSAYANKRLARNDAAVERFEVAIDRTPPVDALALEKRFRMRREVEQIVNTWTVSGNLSLNTLQAATGPPSPIRDTTNGTGSLEVAYQPPAIGYRDGRTVQLYGRLFWNADESSIVPQRESLQAGVGVRWKPLTDYNLVLSAERLIGIGDFAYDDWLARASISFDQNLDWQPVRESWPTGSLYLDAARVIDAQATFLTTIGRWGYAWKKPYGIGVPEAADVINTYGLATASYSQVDDVQTNRVEIGGGLSYQVWFNDTEYQAYRSTAEVALEARYLFQNNAEDAATLQLRLQFRL